MSLHCTPASEDGFPTVHGESRMLKYRIHTCPDCKGEGCGSQNPRCLDGIIKVDWKIKKRGVKYYKDKEDQSYQRRAEKLALEKKLQVADKEGRTVWRWPGFRGFLRGMLSCVGLGFHWMPFGPGDFIAGIANAFGFLECRNCQNRRTKLNAIGWWGIPPAIAIWLFKKAAKIRKKNKKKKPQHA